MSFLKLNSGAGVALVALAMLAASAQPARADEKIVLACTAASTGIRDILTLDLAGKTVDFDSFGPLPDGSMHHTGSRPQGTITSVTDPQILITFPPGGGFPPDAPLNFVLDRYTLSFGPTSAPLYMSCQKQQKQL